MKIKALRTKKEPKEFIHIEIETGYNSFDVFTSDIPKILPITATIEEMKEYYEDWGCEVDFEPFELVEFDLIESGEVGADIRNKLTPSLNLVAMLELYFKDNVAHATEERENLARLIKSEMKKSKENIKYIANLL